jgi:hypothetical protein
MADRCGQMRFTRAGTADEDEVLLVIHELAPMQLTDQCFIDGTLSKIEAAQISIDRETCHF